MVTIKQLRYLVAISDQLHFRRAAEQVHISQPTLSGQLREMEEKLGIQLVERSRARVLLTPIGTEIAERARDILRSVDDIVELAKQGHSHLGGKFRLGVLPSLGPYLLPHFLPALHKSYPRLKLYVREAIPAMLINDLEDGKLDILLFPLPISRADLEYVRIFREPLWVVAPSDHNIAKRKTVRREDLTHQTVLALERGHRLHDQVHHLCEEFNADVALDFEGSSLDTLRQMVAMGLGISFLPSLYVTAEISDSDTSVVARKLDHGNPSRVIGMVWRRHSARTKEFIELADFIRNSLKDVKDVVALR